MKRSKLLILTTIAIVLACNQDEEFLIDPESTFEKFIPSEVEVYNSSGSLVGFITPNYDQHGLITSVDYDYECNGCQTLTHYFNYDDLDRVISECIVNTSCDMSIKYDDDGKVNSITKNGDNIKMEFHYKNGLPNRIDYYEMRDATMKLVRFHLLEYDNNGNLLKNEIFSNEPEIKWLSTTTYIYDDYPNLFSSLDTQYTFFIIPHLSKNNIIEQKYETFVRGEVYRSVKYDYEYNEWGYPVSINITATQNGASIKDETLIVMYKPVKP